jgi:hypothetical protein
MRELRSVSKHLPVNIPKVLYEQLKATSKDLHCTMSFIVLTGVIKELDRLNRQLERANRKAGINTNQDNNN